MNLPNPKEIETINKIIAFFNENFNLGKEYNELTWARFKREAERSGDTWIKYYSLGLLCGMKKDVDKMLDYFQQALLASKDNDVTYNGYINSLYINGLFEESFSFFSQRIDDLMVFENIESMIMLSTALGELDMLKRLNKKVQSMFGNQEKEYGDKMKKFIENENAVRSAYDVTGCSKKQITELAKIFSNIIQKYKVTPSGIDLSDKGGGTYIVNIKTSDYDLIFDMNMDVAEQASSNEILANCNLIGKFEIYQGL